MLLSDIHIVNRLDTGSVIIRPEPTRIQPASIDLTLGDGFRLFASHRVAYIDPRVEQAELTELHTITDGRPFILHPGEFALGHTEETVTLPNDLAARIEGKSSLGRLGLLVHSTAGFVDPGFSGQLTLELSNANTLPIKLWPGMKIGQLCLIGLSGPVVNQYGAAHLRSRYQGQMGPVASRAYLDTPRDGADCSLPVG